MTSTPTIPDPSTPPRVVVIGGGFAGLAVARGLRKAPVQVTLIDRQNHHLFQPLLYQVATAGLSAPSIAAPLRHILQKQTNVEVLMATVTGIDLATQQIDTDAGSGHYDFLVVASGATHAYFGHDDWAPHAPGLKTLDDALAVRRRILSAFERAELADDPVEREAWLTFVVVGAGPTGVELAGTIAEIARHTMRRQFHRSDPTQARVLLVEAGPRVLPAMAEKLSLSAKKQLERIGVEVLLGTPAEHIDGHGLRAGGQVIAARTVLWAAGVAASPLGAMLGADTDRAGRVRVSDDLRLPGQDNVFVAGDLAAVSNPDGSPVPGVAPAAKQMGAHIAAQIRRQLAGESDQAFRYNDQGSMATIGRKAAVAEIKGFKLTGYFAWLAWLLVHIMFLIGFRNRLVVLMDWASAYFSHRRYARIIIGRDAAEAPGAGDRAK